MIKIIGTEYARDELKKDNESIGMCDKTKMNGGVGGTR